MFNKELIDKFLNNLDALKDDECAVVCRLGNEYVFIRDKKTNIFIGIDVP